MIETYALKNYKKMFREPEGQLRHKFIVPGSIHKPCLAQHAVFIVKNNGGDSEWLKPYFGDLLKFIDYYINNFRHHNGIYFWHDDGAIGVDNDPSTFYRPLDSSGSIYLNCLMYKELEAVCYLGKLLKVDISKYQFEKEH